MIIEVKKPGSAGKNLNRKFRRKDFIIEVCTIEVDKRNQNVAPRLSDGAGSIRGDTWLSYWF